MALGAGALVFINGDDGSNKVAATGPAGGDTSPAAPTGAGVKDVRDVLEPTVETRRGTTFQRLATRSGPCTSYANTALQGVLRARPCAGPMNTALYVNGARTVAISVSILPMSRRDAPAVSRTARGNAAPALLLPPAGSLPALGGSVPYWVSSWPRGPYVVFAQSFSANGSGIGPRGGPVHQAGRELGLEIHNVLGWEG